MVELKPKSSNFNSLWSIFYCLIAVGIQCYISYRNISEYQESLKNEWKRQSPSELGVKLGLTIVSFIILPLFILTSVFRSGNFANDGFKLGRDHAICPKSTNIIDHVNSEIIRRLWRHFCPFSSTLHIIIAFCLLFPDVIISAKEIQLQYKPTGAIWSTDIDFLFPVIRTTESELLARHMNTSVLNLTSIAAHHRPVSAPFLNFMFAFMTFAVRYAAVFWYTNKTLSFIFATQLTLMAVDAVFTYSGFSILYKLSMSPSTYRQPIGLVLSPGVILTLYLIGGIVVFLSSLVVFEYGAYHFMEKFRLVDRKHNPQKYNKNTSAEKQPCKGYISHTSAVIMFLLIAAFRGPVYYDTVTVYRLNGDACLLTSLIIGVFYLVLWIFLWTLLTIKQEWMFRILDYANVGQPIFVIKSDRLSKTNSISIGSIELQSVSSEKRLRPASLPSIDITPSESGFDEGEILPSSEDDRFDISLPPVCENSAENSFTNDAIVRRHRNRRSGNRSVTFNDPIRHSVGSLCERDRSRCRSPTPIDNKLNVTADVHRFGPRVQFQRRSSDPEMKQVMRRRQANNAILAAMKNNTLCNDLKSNADYLTNVNDLSTSSDDIRSNASEPLLNQTVRRFENRRCCSQLGNPILPSDISNYKPSNIETAEELNAQRNLLQNNEPSLDLSASITDSGITQTNSTDVTPNSTDVTTILSEEEYENFKGNTQPDIVPDRHSHTCHKVHPVQLNPLKLIPKTTDVKRRDSANYSMTSSQDTSSNDSDPVRQSALCSQV